MAKVKYIEASNGTHMLVETDYDAEFVCIAAAACVLSGSDDNGIPSRYSRGTLKRAIALLRMIQHRKPEECGENCEQAISFIRREWLHREVTEA